MSALLRKVVAAAGIALVLGSLAACGSDGEPAARPRVVHVPADAPTIQEGVDAVAPGGLVLVSPGTYAETVQVRTKDVTVRGEDRNAVVIDGGGIRPYGIVGEADGIRVQNLTVKDTTFYGVLVTGLHDSSGPRANSDQGSNYEKFDPEEFPPLQRFEIDHVTAYNNGLYGIYAFDAQHGSIHDNYASGSADSGFYVGQCHECDILLTDNVGERNAVGFENANASAPLMVVGNRFSNNRVGMTFLSDYQEVFIPERGDVIAGNLVSDNNERRTPQQADGGFGIGIGVSGGTENTFVRNRIEGNRRAGVLLANTNDLPAKENRFRHNSYAHNGVDFADISSSIAMSIGNCAEPGITSLPAHSPSLAADCGPSTPGKSVPPARVGALAHAPRGISFLKVPAPPDQPQLEGDLDAVPGPVPARPDMPAVASVALPSRTLLASMTRGG